MALRHFREIGKYYRKQDFRFPPANQPTTYDDINDKIAVAETDAIQHHELCLISLKSERSAANTHTILLPMPLPMKLEDARLLFQSKVMRSH